MLTITLYAGEQDQTCFKVHAVATDEDGADVIDVTEDYDVRVIKLPDGRMGLEVEENKERFDARNAAITHAGG